jgi:hypothetical protein
MRRAMASESKTNTAGGKDDDDDDDDSTTTGDADTSKAGAAGLRSTKIATTAVLLNFLATN